MIECPSCRHQEFVGTIYCSECGTRLVHSGPGPTMTIPRDRVNAEALVTKPPPPPGPPLGTPAPPPEGPELESGALIGLRILNTGDIVPLIGRDNFTLGRAI